LSREEKIEIIKKGKGVMSSFENKLNEKEIDAVVDYIETLK
jgi:mono/diheme cytochrome c family protein